MFLTKRSKLSELQFVRKRVKSIWPFLQPVIVDFGWGQYKQPGEGWAPSG